MGAPLKHGGCPWRAGARRHQAPPGLLLGKAGVAVCRVPGMVLTLAGGAWLGLVQTLVGVACCLGPPHPPRRNP